MKEATDTEWLGYAGRGHFVEMRTCRSPWIGAEFWQIQYEPEQGRLVLRGRVLDENSSYSLDEPLWLVAGTLEKRLPVDPTRMSGSWEMDVVAQRGAHAGRDFFITLDGIGPDTYLAFVRPTEGDVTFVSAVSRLYRVGALLEGEGWRGTGG